MMFYSMTLVFLLAAAAVQVQSMAINTEEIIEELNALLNFERGCMLDASVCEDELGPNSRCELSLKEKKGVCVCNSGFRLASPTGPCVSKPDIPNFADLARERLRQHAINAAMDKWESLVHEQNASAIVEMYTEDCLYLHQVKGILIGKQAVQEAYEEFFAEGSADSVVTILREDRLGDDHFALLERCDLYDENKAHTYSTTALVIFKKVEDVGFQTFLKAEIINQDV